MSSSLTTNPLTEPGTVQSRTPHVLELLRRAGVQFRVFLAGRRKLWWQIVLSYLVVCLISLAAVSWLWAITVRDLFEQRVRSEVEREADLLKAVMSSLLEGRVTMGQLTTQGFALLGAIEARVELIRENGEVVFDTGPRSDTSAPAAPQVLILRAASSDPSQVVSAERIIQLEGRDNLKLRLSRPMGFIDIEITDLHRNILLVGAVFVLLALGLGVFISQKISGPLRELKRAAQRFAVGDLSSPFPSSPTYEIAHLADAMNEMARMLDTKIRSSLEERHKQGAFVSSMVEGVLAVDLNLRLINFNQAAATLLGVDVTSVIGKPLEDVVDQAEIVSLIKETATSQKALERDIELGKDDKCSYLQVSCTPLRTEVQSGQEAVAFGVLVVLNDITRIKRLEAIRREFAANVSHELRTPITSIKGFVETLLDGAVDNPDDSRRFLGIISNHVNRLDSLIRDLLKLSRIEQEVETQEIAFELSSVGEVVTHAVQLCEQKAQERRVTLVRLGNDPCLAKINPILLEQAVFNLLDNAINFSEEGGQVLVRAEIAGSEVQVSVRDFGPGIPEEYRQRVFERFFRVDKARSRKVGGTGLGLAIVKHVALAHGGRTDVTSEVGKGSEFSISIPRAAETPREPERPQA